MKTDTIFIRKWLTEEKKALKVLLFIICNINNDNICFCYINDICKWFNIQASSVNKNNIKAILNDLQKKKYIEYKEEAKNNYNITITASADDQIIGIYKQWVLEIRQAKINNKNNGEENISVDYTIAIKILIHCLLDNFKSVIKQEEIGKIVGVSKDAVCDALKILKLCNFEKMKFLCETATKGVVTYNLEKQQREWKQARIGTYINIGLIFN